MQEDLNEQLTLRFKTSKEPTIEFLTELGISEAIVFFNKNLKYIRFDAIRDEKNKPIKSICVRDTENAKLLYNKELVSGTDACLVCVNCMVCITKNSKGFFQLNE